MPGEQATVVRPIFRRGDRVLVRTSFGYFDVVVQWYEIKEGKLWLCGEGPGFGGVFPVTDVIRRISPHQPWG